ncbi:hypothetical protein VULLAG_LOCUS14807 [Vulpes lagopus]
MDIVDIAALNFGVQMSQHFTISVSLGHPTIQESQFHQPDGKTPSPFEMESSSLKPKFHRSKLSAVLVLVLD